MYTIIKAWYYSVGLVNPFTLFPLLKNGIGIYWRSSLEFISNFAWLIALDAILFLSFGDLIAKATMIHAKTGAQPGGVVVLLTLAQSITCFILSSVFLLLIRKDSSFDIKIYLRAYFFRYVQLLLVFSLVFMLGIYFLMLAGITKLPPVPWLILLIVKVGQFCITFYWLDSSNRMVDLFISFERAVNLIFYNIPFITFLVGTLWLLDVSLAYVFSFIVEQDLSHILFSNTLITDVLKNFATFPMLIKVIAIKYCSFLFECVWLSLLFVFYSKKRRERYASNIFERQWH